jgi:hypothetical protein
MQFLVQIESTKNSSNIIITSITTTTSCMIMLNPPNLIEHNIIVILLWGESIIKWTLCDPCLCKWKVTIKYVLVY